jgi:hypothetical protein
MSELDVKKTEPIEPKEEVDVKVKSEDDAEPEDNPVLKEFYTDVSIKTTHRLRTA